MTDYIELGLALGNHVEGFVDAYYGPPELARRNTAKRPAEELRERARSLLARLESEEDSALDPRRRHWLSAQVKGLYTSARKLAGEDVAYLDEIEQCYGVRPQWRPEEDFAEAHRRLDAVVPGDGPVMERYVAWREAARVPPELLRGVVEAIAVDFRQRTDEMFGLPDGEQVDFEFVTDQPWSGFNYYLGGLRSRVAINTDLPVLSPAVGHLVAHEAYPGHHTEHSRKEVGLVRRHHHDEETIFLVGTPQCLIAEGLADLGLEVIAGPNPHEVVGAHMQGVPFEAEVVAQVAEAAEVLGAVRGNAAIGLHDRGWDQDQAVSYIERWGLTSRERATQGVRFLTDPTWRAYPFCYIDGVRLCRQFVDGDPARFERLISEQMTPEQLVA